jgi:hypothetical protein
LKITRIDRYEPNIGRNVFGFSGLLDAIQHAFEVTSFLSGDDDLAEPKLFSALSKSDRNSITTSL